MDEIVNDVLSFVLSCGVGGGFAVATVCNLLARGIGNVLALFNRF